MRTIISALAVFFISVSSIHAQRMLEKGGMTYFIGAKPNVIIYHDTIFNGVKEFRSLFYRHHDMELTQLLDRHQSNKISGNILGVVGTVATIIGIGQISRENKGVGWALTGGGIAATLTSGYLLLMGQRNLATAVTLFNQRYRSTSLNLGISGNGAGLVYKF